MMTGRPFGALCEGKLVLKEPDALVIPDRARRLARAIARRIPRVRLQELLLQVDAWTGFTENFRSDPAIEPDAPPHPPKVALLARLVAEGTNLGLDAMTLETPGLSREDLARVGGTYVHEETLRAASEDLAEYHRQLPLASLWSPKTRLAWEGSRSPTPAAPAPATFYPWYFGGSGRSASSYGSAADERAACGLRVISCPPRQALAVLDALLGNHSFTPIYAGDPPPREYEEPLFGICDLLGYAWMPRLSDLSDQRLYKMDPAQTYSNIEPLFHGAVDLAPIHEEWDFMMRVAVSLRDRVSPARLLVPKLVRAADARRAAAAFVQLGRIVKSMYILRYIDDPVLRRRVHLQAHWVEHRRRLARRLCFSAQGELPKSDADQVMETSSALAVLANAVLVWSTVRIGETVQAIRATGETVLDEDLAVFPPLLSAHVLVKGPYAFGSANPDREDRDEDLG